VRLPAVAGGELCIGPHSRRETGKARADLSHQDTSRIFALAAPQPNGHGIGSQVGDRLSQKDPDAPPEPLEWGYSLANVREILLGCLDAVGARSVLEIGAFRGELTVALLDWASTTGATITALDPVPPGDLLALAKARPELELIEETSHDVLARLDSLPQAIVIDGDHNYYTLSEELRLVAERVSGNEWPLLIFHDVCWPHARRDTYYAPERVPEEHRQPLAHNVGLAPGEPGVAPLGLPFIWAAAREGGPENGTLTAIEDFMRSRAGLRLAVVPAFFGLGLIWHPEAPGGEAVGEAIAPFDQNAVLARLEAHRVAHLVAGQARTRELEALKIRSARQEAALRKLPDSRAFALAERLSALRRGGEPYFTRAEIREALE